MGNCFSCHKKLGLIKNWRDVKTIQKYGYKPPEGMSKNDKLCATCLDVIVSMAKEVICKDCGIKLDPNLTYCSNCKSNTKTEKPIQHKPQRSPRSIKWDYYFGIFTLIVSPIMILLGLSTENHLSWISGIVFLVIGIIQFPKRKKAFNRLSENKDNVSEQVGSPLAVLKMRLAKGEITTEEFDKIKEDLKD